MRLSFFYGQLSAAMKAAVGIFRLLLAENVQALEQGERGVQLQILA